MYRETQELTDNVVDIVGASRPWARLTRDGAVTSLWGFPIVIAIMVFQFVTRPAEPFRVHHLGNGTLRVQSGVYTYTLDEPFEVYESDSKGRSGVVVHNVCVRTTSLRSSGQRGFCNIPSGLGPFVGKEDFDNDAEVARSTATWNRRWVWFGLGGASWLIACIAHAFVLERRRQGQLSKLTVYPGDDRLRVTGQKGENIEVRISDLKKVVLIGKSTLVLTMAPDEEELRIKLGDMDIPESYELIERLQAHLPHAND